jgi:hypothetical protein
MLVGAASARWHRRCSCGLFGRLEMSLDPFFDRLQSRFDVVLPGPHAVGIESVPFQDVDELVDVLPVALLGMDQRLERDIEVNDQVVEPFVSVRRRPPVPPSRLGR